MSYEMVAFLVIAGAALGAAAAIGGGALTPFPRRLFVLAVALRVAGSALRYEVLQRSYGGVGDPAGYYGWGLRFANRIWSGQAPEWPEPWLGFHFLYRISGPVVALIGPTMRGEFLVFALLSFAGLYWMARAVAQVSSAGEARRFATWLWLWPSLWFWPASVGKEAIMIFGLGLVLLGFAGRGGALRWGPYAAGLGLCFCARPHVAALLALAAGLAHAVTARGLGRRRLIAAAVAIAVALAVGWAASVYLDVTGPGELWELAQRRAQRTLEGRSRVDLPSGPLAVGWAFVNVWLRPMPWEVYDAPILAAAAEVMLLAGLVWHRRRAVLAWLPRWRARRLVPLAILVLIGYTLMIGLFFGNQGLITRQRTLALPFLFLLLAAPASEKETAAGEEGS